MAVAAFARERERAPVRAVEARADALEPLAEGMCKRIQRMNVIDDALEMRLPSGKPIDLLSVKKAE